ncbi:uromodulin-like [Protopterus annectens]|uniref:uromodulin-like n=1 Tax=Protopterus annectens TaxID=7888 RepID=UPI001CF9FB8B|nr:uromodulin-like [Protopterus annectens]
MAAYLGIILTIAFINQVYSQCSEPCLYDEICSPDDSEIYSCYCNGTMYNISPNPDFPLLLSAAPVYCGPQHFAIGITPCMFRNMYQYMILQPDEDPTDNQCFDSTNGDLFAIVQYQFNFSSTNGNCQAVTSVNSTHITYSVPVWFRYNNTGSQVILHNDIRVTYMCSYPVTMNSSLDFGLYPVVSTNNITVSGSGTYTTTMQLYKYSNYTGPYTKTDLPISLAIETPLYIGASVLGADSRFSLVLISCYATPTNNADDTIKYKIISESCPIPGSTGVSLKRVGDGLTDLFSINLFKFTSASQVYLHCSFSLCLGRCVPVSIYQFKAICINVLCYSHTIFTSVHSKHIKPYVIV